MTMFKKAVKRRKSKKTTTNKQTKKHTSCMVFTNNAPSIEDRLNQANKHSMLVAEKLCVAVRTNSKHICISIQFSLNGDSILYNILI